jgi:hypothetical protein
MITKKLETFYIVNKIKEHKQYKEELLSLIDKMPDQSPNGTITKSDWNLKRETSPEYLTLFYEIINPYMNEMCTFLKQEKWNIPRGWFQQYLTGSSHGWHVHFGANYTNVYYLELPKGDKMKTQVLDLHTEKVYELEVEEGDLITFPAGLLHRADVNTTDKRKTIISYDSDFMAKGY